MARNDPLRFLEWFVFTLDQHDQEHPIKPFPAERPHIEYMTRLWQSNRLLAVKKSRQLLMTWLFTALGLWDAMFHEGRLIIFQSKREEDAVGDETAGDGLLGRAKFILNHVPCREALLPWYIPKYKKIEFPDNSSTIWAIPQGSNVIRQRTASGVLSDEAAFQDEFAHAYTAMVPCIRGGGWIVAVSSAHPGFFERLHEDRLDEDQ